MMALRLDVEWEIREEALHSRLRQQEDLLAQAKAKVLRTGENYLGVWHCCGVQFPQFPGQDREFWVGYSSANRPAPMSVVRFKCTSDNNAFTVGPDVLWDLPCCGFDHINLK